MKRPLLTPDLRCLTRRDVLLQAWKKVDYYTRRHNWYADTLELDVATAGLDAWLDQLPGPSAAPNDFRTAPMRLIPAPKAGTLQVAPSAEVPLSFLDPEERLFRPLAHLRLRDQVLAAAFMLCLADAVETAQGDPSTPKDSALRRGVVSYGNRLHCHWEGGRAWHPWGSRTTYRNYYTDYRAWLGRCREVPEGCATLPDSSVWLVSADLSRCYDRIPRAKLLEMVADLAIPGAADASRSAGAQRSQFLTALEQSFDWRWHRDDHRLANLYVETLEPVGDGEPDLAGFGDEEPWLGLPQGLVSAGFLCNVFLHAFDRAVLHRIEADARSRGGGPRRRQDKAALRIRLLDYARYVDDLRFVVEVSTPHGSGSASHDKRDKVRAPILELLKGILAESAPGMVLNEDKLELRLASEGASATDLADRMNRLQRLASGPLGVDDIQSLLDEIEGTLDTAERLALVSRSEDLKEVEQRVQLVTATRPDVRWDTLARFGANKWRSTFRRGRLMAPEAGEPRVAGEGPSRRQLDHRARERVGQLLRIWLCDPSQLRLLRVGFDVYPLREALELVLEALEPLLCRRCGALRLSQPTDDSCPILRMLAGWMGAELLRAGATETGLASDDDELPSNHESASYRDRLRDFARAVLPLNADHTGAELWYLHQQALLFLAQDDAPIPRRRREALSDAELLRPYTRWHDLLDPLWGEGYVEAAVARAPAESDDAWRDLALIALTHDVKSCAEAGRADQRVVALLDAFIRRLGEPDDRWTARLLSLPYTLLQAWWAFRRKDRSLEDWTKRFARHLGFRIVTVYERDMRAQLPEGSAPKLNDLDRVARHRSRPFADEISLLRLMRELARLGACRSIRPRTRAL